MKTEMALLLMTDGKPMMTLQQLAELRGIDYRTAQNQVAARRHPIPVWKDGVTYFAHVSDVARWIDEQREEALKAQQKAA